MLVHDGRASAFTTTVPTGAEEVPSSRSGGPTTCRAQRTCWVRSSEGGDALVRLNDAFAPDPVFVDVPAGVHVDAPLAPGALVRRGGAAFPRTCVRVGGGARGSVVEVFAGAPGAGRTLVVPVTELAAADDASVSYVSLQILGDAAWSIARLAARGTADSSVRTFTVGLGGAYDRVRADVVGRGA